MFKIKWYYKILLGILLFYVIMFLSSNYAQKYHRDIKSNQKKYCHNPTFGYYIWVIEKLEYSEEYIDFCKRKEKNNFPTNKKFEFESIPNNSEVYVLGYEKDSVLSKIVCYYTKRGFGQLVEGYIYSKWLYDIPVEDIANPKGDDVFFPDK